ncbi:MAG: hypothetical protein J6Y39_06750 [Bacteroidaceae bacterium]|nr:hypothetical protein [Bacteroidaceae bacterium]
MSIFIYHAYKRNRPIASVIKDFVNKESRRVGDSRKEIKKRFIYLDWALQKKILTLFLNSGKYDREWAFFVLSQVWDKSFEPLVRKLWERYHEDRCTWVVIRHFPVNYIRENLEALAKGRNYYFICKRLEEAGNFDIDRERLSNLDYLALMSEQRKTIVDKEEALDIMYRAVHELCITPLKRNNIPSVYKGAPISCASFGVIRDGLHYFDYMGYSSAAAEFRQWNDGVMKSLEESPEFRHLCESPIDGNSFEIRATGLLFICIYKALDDKYKLATDPPIEVMKIPVSHYRIVEQDVQSEEEREF